MHNKIARFAGNIRRIPLSGRRLNPLRASIHGESDECIDPVHSAIIHDMSQASQVIRLEQPPSIVDPNEIPAAETDAVPRAGLGSGLARSALIVAAAFVLSRVLGLVREVILADQFGTGPE